MAFLARLARPRFAYVWIFVFSLALNAGITGLTGVPGPETHDEFSYLLAADTFAHGRVTNPPHPMWRHFESFHILQQPTYQSKYQPGQGAVLGLGEAATGMPIVGEWLAAALAAVAIAWGIRPWVARRWAFLGGGLVALHPLMLLWSQNYWGGALTAVGGALVFGAASRLARKVSVGMGAVLGVGVAVLFNTRPYEGMVFSALVIGWLLMRIGGGTRTGGETGGPSVRPLNRRRRGRLAGVGALVGVLGLATCWTAYYDYRVTGHPLRLPYLVHERQYALAPPFLWQSELPAKAYRHDALRQYNEEVELPHFRGQRSVGGFVAGVGDKLWILAKAYGAQPVIVVAIVGLVFAGRWGTWSLKRPRHLGEESGAALRCAPGLKRGHSWRGWFAAIILVVFVGVLMLSNWTFPHYAAPAFVLLIVLVVAGLRPLVARWRFVLPVFLLVYVGTAGWWIVDRARTYPQSFGRMRQSLVEELRENPGDDLVLVRYESRRNINTEWVYNPADLDRAPVLFAHDMGAEGNAELLRYYAGRTVWELDVGDEGARISPYVRMASTTKP